MISLNQSPLVVVANCFAFFCQTLLKAPATRVSFWCSFGKQTDLQRVKGERQKFTVHSEWKRNRTGRVRTSERRFGAFLERDGEKEVEEERDCQAISFWRWTLSLREDQTPERERQRHTEKMGGGRKWQKSQMWLTWVHVSICMKPTESFRCHLLLEHFARVYL